MQNEQFVYLLGVCITWIMILVGLKDNDPDLQRIGFWGAFIIFGILWPLTMSVVVIYSVGKKFR
jgi:hypothetical protein